MNGTKIPARTGGLLTFLFGPTIYTKMGGFFLVSYKTSNVDLGSFNYYSNNDKKEQNRTVLA